MLSNRQTTQLNLWTRAGMSGVCKQRIGHKFNLRESFLYRFTHFQNNSCIYICMYLASPYCQEKLDLGNLGNVLLGYVHVRKTQTKINCLLPSPKMLWCYISSSVSTLPRLPLKQARFEWTAFFCFCTSLSSDDSDCEYIFTYFNWQFGLFTITKIHQFL